MREVHSADWDLSRGRCYTSPGEGFSGTDRTIFLGCSDQRGEKFAIKIYYSFQVAHSTKISPFLRPMTAKVVAARFWNALFLKGTRLKNCRIGRKTSSWAGLRHPVLLASFTAALPGGCNWVGLTETDERLTLSMWVILALARSLLGLLLLVNPAVAMMEPTTRGGIPPITIPRQSFQHNPRLCHCYARCSRHYGRKPLPLLDLQEISAFNRQLCTLQ